MSLDTSKITGQIESFVQSAKQMENELAAERARYQKISREYLEVRQKLEGAVRGLQEHVQRRNQMIEQLNTAVQTHRQNESKMTQYAQEMAQRERQILEQLNQYKAAWAEVLTRETEARNALAELDKLRTLSTEQRLEMERLRRELVEAQRHNEGLARHVETYQRELQGATLRIQSAEAKFNQLSREYQVALTQKRSADEEIAKLEANMKERFKWELATERERIRAEVEKEASLDRERFRELTRRALAVEQEQQLKVERAKIQELEKHNHEIRSRLQTLHSDALSENEKLRQELAAARKAFQEEIESKKKQVLETTKRADSAEQNFLLNQDALNDLRERLREQEGILEILKGEKHQLQNSFDESRRNFSKNLIVERLRFEAELEKTHALYARELVEVSELAGIQITKVDPADVSDSEGILTAHPITNVSSSDPKASSLPNPPPFINH